MKYFLKCILPQRLKNFIKGNISTAGCPKDELRNSTSFTLIGEPSPIIKEVFEFTKTVPGWFNIDDCSHFYLILSLQSACGIEGDLFEIGSYHGRSAALMSRCLQRDEKIVICDAFESDTEDHYTNKPSPESLIYNILTVNPNLETSRIVVHQCLSNVLSLKKEDKFRFIHIDGGHASDQVYGDLCLSREHLVDKGIIAIDD